MTSCPLCGSKVGTPHAPTCPNATLEAGTVGEIAAILAIQEKLLGTLQAIHAIQRDLNGVDGLAVDLLERVDRLEDDLGPVQMRLTRLEDQVKRIADTLGEHLNGGP